MDAVARNRSPEFLNTVLGKPETPRDVVDRMIDLGRMVGKTQALIDALPDDGNADILILKSPSAKNLRERILASRGTGYPVRNLRFIARGQRRISGLERPLFIDNDVFDAMIMENADRIFKSITGPF